MVYEAYGLRIHSTVPIRGLHELPAGPHDLQLNIGQLPAGLETGRAETLSGTVSPASANFVTPTLERVLGSGYLRLVYPDGIRFGIAEAGDEIWVQGPQNSPPEMAFVYLLGPVLAIVLRLRGLVCLHGCVIEAKPGAVAILGPHGAGKSTLALAFRNAGYRILSDDVLLVLDRGDEFFVQPSYPRLKLWPDSIEALLGRDVELPFLVSTCEKRFLDLPAAEFSAESRRLSCIYVLGERIQGNGPSHIECLAGSKALMALLGNLYPSYPFLLEMHNFGFINCTRVISHVPVKRLMPNSDVSCVPAIVNMILKDVEELTRSVPVSGPSCALCSVL